LEANADGSPASEADMSRVTLPEPVEIAKFWANRKGEAIVISLATFEGRNLVDVRKHYTSREGKLLPTPKGLALQVLRLPVTALTKALGEARRLRLLGNEAEGEA
jgi:hypothetical protein